MSTATLGRRRRVPVQLPQGMNGYVVTLTGRFCPFNDPADEGWITDEGQIAVTVLERLGGSAPWPVLVAAHRAHCREVFGAGQAEADAWLAEALIDDAASFAYTRARRS